MKNRKVFLTLLVLGIGLVLFGTSYAFFEYIKVGANHELIAGDIYMNFDGGTDSLSLGSVYPETKEHARSRDDNYITFTIEGTNDSNKNIYYEIDLIHGDEHSGLTRFNDKDLKFDLSEIVDGEETLLKSAVSFNEINNTKIYVDTISSETENYTRTFKLRMWLSENVLISDTNPHATYSASTYKNHYASVKVKVVGDFDDSRTKINVMGTFENTPIYDDNIRGNIREVYFINDTQDTIESRYNAATIKADVTNTDHTVGTLELQNMEDYGKVLAWVEPIPDTSYYNLYVGSDGETYLSTGAHLFGGADLTPYGYRKVWSQIIKIDLQNVKTDYVVDFSEMFAAIGYYNTPDLLEIIGIKDWNTSNVTNMYRTFGTINTKFSDNLDLSNWDTSNVTDMSYMFQSLNFLFDYSIIGLEYFNTSKVTNMEEMFALFCDESGVINLDLSNWDTSSVTNMMSMFHSMGRFNSDQLINFNITNWNTSNVTKMDGMFGYCSSLAILDLSSFDTSNVTDMYLMFNECPNLTTIYVGTGWNTDSYESTSPIFSNCPMLVGGNGTTFSSSHEDKSYAHVDAPGNPGYLTLKTS